MINVLPICNFTPTVVAYLTPCLSVTLLIFGKQLTLSILFEGLEEMISSTVTGVLERTGLLQAVENLQRARDATDSSSSAHSSTGQHQANVAEPSNRARIGPVAVYAWGKKLHLFPENFTFPAGGLLVQWQHYCWGNISAGLPPLRF